MNSTLSKVFIFAAGAIIGSAATWKFFKTKYERIAQEEIDSVYEAVSNRSNTDNEPSETNVKETEDVEVEELVNKLKNLKYTDIKEVPKVKAPYVISPDVFGEEDDYDTETLYYCEDGVLIDEQDNLIEDVDDVVGVDSLNHFGEYEDDSVFVRNEREQTDYEILLDPRKYSDIVNSGPHPTEDE